MKCDLNYCIYNKESICILDEIQMNSLGMYDDCIIVSLPEEILKAYKQIKLQEIMSRYENPPFDELTTSYSDNATACRPICSQASINSFREDARAPESGSLK